MTTYASGEYPEVGDVVTFRGYKPTRPATVLEVDDKDDPRFVKVRWGNSKNTQEYGIEDLVLVTPAEAFHSW
jgi:hypothetical protein